MINKLNKKSRCRNSKTSERFISFTRGKERSWDAGILKLMKGLSVSPEAKRKTGMLDIKPAGGFKCQK